MKLSYQSVQSSPCHRCKSSDCCKHLLLNQLTAHQLQDLDTIKYYLNFVGLKVAFNTNGQWSIYYQATCDKFVESDQTCSIHGQPSQPAICVHYNPYQCFYKSFDQVKNQPNHDKDSFIWMNVERFNHLVSALEFDESHMIIGLKQADSMLQQLNDIPYATSNLDKSVDNTIIKPQTIDADFRQSWQQLSDPCSACSAYCCRELVFPVPTPITYNTIDFINYALGFPGVSLGIHEHEWVLIVDVQCGHLNNNRCDLYNDPQRPLFCTYYDKHNCSYKKYLGSEPPHGYKRLTQAAFQHYFEQFSFDCNGILVEMPEALKHESAY